MVKDIVKIKVWDDKVLNRMEELYHANITIFKRLVANSPLFYKRLVILMNGSINDIIKEAEELEEYEMANELLHIKKDPDALGSMIDNWYIKMHKE